MAKKLDLFQELGVTGVHELAGMLSDRYAETLHGSQGVVRMARVLRREPAAFTAWNAATLAAQPVRWYVTPATDAKADVECAEFVESCINDLSSSWLSCVRFAMSAWAFGFADQEIVWKRRLGHNPGKDLPPSKWDDERVGVRKLAPRRQETLYDWLSDDTGGKVAMRQLDPTTGKIIGPIPIEKLLHYVGGDDRGSWEGLGWLEPAYWMAVLIENLEKIGGATAMRGGTGLPVFTFTSQPDPTTTALIDEIGDGLAAGELQYVKLPGPLVGFDLKTVSLSNLGDIRGWIDQLRWEITALLMATFVRLGSTDRGTQALGGTMYDAFTLGIDGCIDGIADVLNRYLVPRLLANNPGDFKGIADYPVIAHAPVTKLPPATAQYLDKVQAWLDAADGADAEWLRSLFAMPYRSAADIEKARAEKQKQEEAAAQAAQAEQMKLAQAQAAAGESAPPPAPGDGKVAPPKGVTPPALAASAAAAQTAAKKTEVKMSAPGDADLFNPYHDRAGRFASKNDAGAGSGGPPDFFSRPAADRRAAWEQMTQGQRDDVAQAETSIRGAIHGLVNAYGAPPQTGNLHDDIRARVAQLADLMPAASQEPVRQLARDLSDLLGEVGAAYETAHPLVLDAVDTLAAQEHEALGRQLGDHGIRHIKGDADMAQEIIRTIPGPDTPVERLSATLAAIYHDTGYLTEPSRRFLDDGHPRWSGDHYDANVKPLVTAIVGARQANRIRDMITTHDSPEMDWQEDKVASAVRAADNLALFHAQKLPAVFHHVSGNTDVLIRLGRKEIDLAAAQNELRANIDASDHSAKVKARLRAAAAEVSDATPKFTAGMLAGTIAGLRWNGHLEVDVLRNKHADPAHKLLDLGQRQFAKLAKTYGINPEEFRQKLAFNFQNQAGRTVLAARVVGYKSGVALSEPVPAETWDASRYPAAVRAALLTAAVRIVAGQETPADVALAARLLPEDDTVA